MQPDINNIIQTQDRISELLLNLNISVTSHSNFPKHMSRALQTIGEFSHHDRIHIIEIHHNMTFTVQHEWCAEEIQPIPEKWRHAAIIYSSPWEQQLNTQNYIIVRDNPETIPEIHTLLEEQNCQQMLLLPLFESGSQFAFMVFMQCKQTHDWQPEEIGLLSNFASVIAAQLNNHLLTSRLLKHLKKHEQESETIHILHQRLKSLHTTILPIWEQIRRAHPDSPEISQLDNQLMTLEKLCDILPEK